MRGGGLWSGSYSNEGLCQAVTMAGFTVEQTSRVLRDTAGPAVARTELPSMVRARHALGILGRSLALRASPVAGP